MHWKRVSSVLAKYIYVLTLVSSAAHVSKPSDFVASVSSSYPIMLVAALQVSLGSSRKWKGSCRPVPNVNLLGDVKLCSEHWRHNTDSTTIDYSNKDISCGLLLWAISHQSTIQGQTRKIPVQRCAACCGVEVLLNFLAKLGGGIICNHSSLGNRAMSLSFSFQPWQKWWYGRSLRWKKLREKNNISTEKISWKNRIIRETNRARRHKTNHNERNWRRLL